jgi:hypothetical protein
MKRQRCMYNYQFMVFFKIHALYGEDVKMQNIILPLEEITIFVTKENYFSIAFCGKIKVKNGSKFYTLQFESICGPGILYFIDIRLLYLKLVNLAKKKFAEKHAKLLLQIIFKR